ncbi:MAG: AMP-binding protein [Acidimicrobiales bacterium]
MNRLVALDLPGGAAFLEAMTRAHDAGDAVWPVDQRLPVVAQRRLVATLRPAAVVTPTGAETPSDDPIPVEEGDAFVVVTSGTTGDPRGVVLTHDAIAASAEATNARLRVDPDRDRWLCCLPIVHVGGLSVITRALASKTPLEIHESFDVARVVDAARRGATLISLVPTTCRRLGDEARRFRTILLGGGAIPRDKPPNAVATYGMTETASGVVYDGWPIDGVTVRVTDGEIEINAPMLLRCYRDGTDPKRNGWFKTGDAGRLLDDESIEVFGRTAEVIRSGGEMVWPSPVEESLRSHPKVRDAAVVGVADEEWQERVVAVVEADDETPPDLDELRAHVAGQLGPIAAPREVIVVDALPRTVIGKVRRDAVRELASGRRR